MEISAFLPHRSQNYCSTKSQSSVFSTLEIYSYPLYPPYKIAHHDANWWPARPSHTEGRMAKYWLLTSSQISEYSLMEVQPFSALLHLTTEKPKSLQYKEPINYVHRFQYPRNLQLPTLPTLHNWKIAHHDANWWPASPSHTEGRMDYWRELFRSTFANSTTELYI